MRSEAPDYRKLEQVIRLDVGVGASLLKIANSAFLGGSGHIRTLRDALQMLGLQTVASAIAALSLRKAFAHVPNLERFWDASACIAQISGWLARQLSFPDRTVQPDEVYTFGLFRDAGIPILLANYADYMDILRQANAETAQPFTDVEDGELGVNHAMIGAKLAQAWVLPGEYLAAIEGHHDLAALGGESPIPVLPARFIAIAQLAEYFHQRASQMSVTHEWDKLGAACLDTLGLDAAGAEALYRRMLDEKVPLRPVH